MNPFRVPVCLSLGTDPLWSQDEIESHQDSITKAHVSLKTNKRNVAKLQKAIAKTEADIEANQARMEELEAEFKATEEKAQRVIEVHKETQELLKGKEAELKALKK